jgi:hypothetical protein
MPKYYKEEKEHYMETNENRTVKKGQFPHEVVKGDFVERFDHLKGKNVVKMVNEKIEYPNGAIVLEVVEVEGYGT